jgi:hypothetical protein
MIGIDFDNTIVSYDDVFYKAALERDLIPASIGRSKGAVRDYLRSIGREDDWTELQGYIYGARMDLARPYEGVEEFFSRRPNLCIISHKTLHPYKGPQYNLHEAAQGWLKNYPSFQNTPAFFELTLKEKLLRIAKAQCTVFIDDLPELLLEKEFPTSVQKILFDPHSLFEPHPSYQKVSSWKEISTLL